MRVWIIAVMSAFLLGAGPLWAEDGAKKAPEKLEESHLKAAIALIQASDVGDVASQWSDDKLKATFAKALDNPEPGSKSAEFLDSVVVMGQQTKMGLLGIMAALVAREMSEKDISKVLSMYQSGVPEEKIYKSKAGKKWRQARIDTSKDMEAAVTIMEHKFMEAAVKEYERIFGASSAK